MTDLTPNDLSHLSDEAFEALCPQGEHAPGPEPLSPAQAIVKAFDDRYELLGPLEDDWQEQCIAAAIRALADQADPKTNIKDISYTHQNYVDGWKDALDVIFAIATELEDQ
jgi:hypothetical protein